MTDLTFALWSFILPKLFGQASSRETYTWRTVTEFTSPAQKAILTTEAVAYSCFRHRIVSTVFLEKGAGI